MAGAPIPPGEYRIQSAVPNPGLAPRVLDFQGGAAPGNQVISFPNDGGPNQIWNVQFFNADNNSCSFQAAGLFMFSNNIIPGANIIAGGLPVGGTPFQLRPSPNAGQFLITSPAQAGAPMLALQAPVPPAPGVPNPPVTFQPINPDLQSQHWQFVPI